MPASLRRADALAESVAQGMQPFRKPSCGKCGQAFDSKADKMRHKRVCGAETTRPAPITDTDYTPPQHLYTDMRRHVTPRIKALAAAEWDAMDWRGNLPDDWPERRAEIERQFELKGGRCG